MGRFKFFCFPSHILPVSKRSRGTGFPNVNQQDEPDVYQRNGIANSGKNDEPKSISSTSKLELASLLTGASLEKPAGVKANVLWNYIPTHATDIRANKGDIVNVFYRNGEWLFVENSLGAQGFIPFNFCSLPRGKKGRASEWSDCMNKDDEKLRIFESENEVPSVIEFKNKSKDELPKTEVDGNTFMVNRATEGSQYEGESVEAPYTIECKETDQTSVINLGKSNEVNQENHHCSTRYMSTGDRRREEKILKVTEERVALLDGTRDGTRQGKLLDVNSTQNDLKASESSNNESASTHSDNSEKKKGLRFLSRRLRKEGKARKKEKRKKRKTETSQRGTKNSLDNHLLEPYATDVWDWYLCDSDSSSDSSDEEPMFDTRNRYNGTRGSFRTTRYSKEEAFVTGASLPRKIDDAYSLAEKLIAEREELLMTYDDIVIRSRTKYGEEDLERNSMKTRHFSMLLEDSKPNDMVRSAKSHDFSGGFAQVRKLNTSTQLEELRGKLAELQMKERLVPKPKCLIEDDTMNSPMETSISGAVEPPEIYEEQLDEELMLVVETFIAENLQEISVTAGERVFVCNACEHEDWWWATTMDGREGYLPRDYLVPLINDLDATKAQDAYLKDTGNQDEDNKGHAIEFGPDQHSSNVDTQNKEINNTTNARNVSLFPRSLPLSDRNETQSLDRRYNNNQVSKSPPKMAMVAPTPRTDIVPANYNSSHDIYEEIKKPLHGEEDELLKKDIVAVRNSHVEDHKFHSYENINSELFLDSVRKHLEVIDADSSNQDRPIINDYVTDSSDDTSYSHDPSWVSSYLDRYTNRVNKPRDDRPRALRRRDTIASTRPSNKRVRFQSDPSLSSSGVTGDPVVVVHRYEAESQDNDDSDMPKYVMKNGTRGEMELATWC